MPLLHNRTNQPTAFPLCVLRRRLHSSFLTVGKCEILPKQVTIVRRGVF